MHLETRFDELKRCARFDARDAELLLAFRAAALPAFPVIVHDFCEQVREHLTEKHERDASQTRSRFLGRSLATWLMALCSGVYDESHCQCAEDAGHEQLHSGLPQHHLHTAMARIRIALLRIADADLGELAGPTRDALNRILDIDLAVMSETYRLAEALARDAENLSAIANLAAGLAHEIRNPLHGAQLHLVILERAIRANTDDQAALQAADVVRVEIRRVASMLTAFLELAHPKPRAQ